MPPDETTCSSIDEGRRKAFSQWFSTASFEAFAKGVSSCNDRELGRRVWTLLVDSGVYEEVSSATNSTLCSRLTTRAIGIWIFCMENRGIISIQEQSRLWRSHRYFGDSASRTRTPSTTGINNPCKQRRCHTPAYGLHLCFQRIKEKMNIWQLWLGSECGDSIREALESLSLGMTAWSNLAHTDSLHLLLLDSELRLVGYVRIRLLSWLFKLV